MQSLKVRHQALHEDITIQQNLIKSSLDFTKYNKAKRRKELFSLRRTTFVYVLHL